MSFDLTAFSPNGPRTLPDVRQSLDDEEQRLVVGRPSEPAAATRGDSAVSQANWRPAPGGPAVKLTV